VKQNAETNRISFVTGGAFAELICQSVVNSSPHHFVCVLWNVSELFYFSLLSFAC